MGEEPRVLVVVLNWNGAADTGACVDSLRRLRYADFAVVVCDNDSRADQLDELRRWGRTLPGGLPEIGPDAASLPAPVALLRTGANLGFAGGVNMGLRVALAQPDVAYAWILNNDCIVDPDALGALVERMRRDARLGLCGSTLVFHHARDTVQALGGASYQPWRGRSKALGAFAPIESVPSDPGPVERRMDYVVGASMLVSRAFLERVGLMDDSYFLYSEEHDWAHRGRRAGFGLGWAPRSHVFHKHGATIGTAPSGGSERSLFYLYRNKALFTARHYPWRLPVAMLWLVWDGLKFALKGQGRKARAVFRGLLAFPRLGRFPAE